MQKNKRFSIIIPTLNEEKYLPKLLTSLAQQTRRNFEVIIVDGNSTDKTTRVAKSYDSKLPKLTVIDSKKANLPLQRNLGARRAKGEWLVFVDADSVLLSYCIERAEKFIHKTDTTFFTSWSQPDSDKPGDAISILIGICVFEGSILFHRALAPGSFSMMRRDVFEGVGGYDENATFGEDLDLSLRVNKKGIRLSILRETLYVWSLRRMRKFGGLKMATQYMINILNGLFFNKSFKNMPGYVMGGQEYENKSSSIK